MAPTRAVRVLLVVDGYFSLGPQDRDDRSFSISHLISVFKRSPLIFLDTAHRDGDHSATIWGKFNFATTVPDLNHYDQIWLFGYNGPNVNDLSNPKFKKEIDEDELFALAKFMENGGGILASGDHEGLGCFMCGRIPRVRTMRKWFAEDDDSEYAKESLPAKAPRNWPARGENRADTLQKDVRGEFNFTNQSDNIPQPLTLVPVPGVGDYHPLFSIGGQGPEKVLRHFPDHFHEGEVLGYGGVPKSEPWATDKTLTFKGVEFVEYPEKTSAAKERPLPRVIATGKVIDGHSTAVEVDKLCDSGFRPDKTIVKGKSINTLCVYDGHEAGIGRVLTDSSFHHFADLNLIGDPCADAEKVRGFELGLLDEYATFFINCVYWLANPRVNKSH